MKNLKTIKSCVYTLVFLMFFINPGFSQLPSTLIEASVPNTNIVRSKPYTLFPTYIQFNSKSDLKVENLETWIKKTTNNNSFGIKLLDKTNDKLGFTHFRFQQTINNIPVEQSMLIVHQKDGKIKIINGDFFTFNLPKSYNSTLSFINSLAKAKKHIGAKKYKWELPGEELFIKREQKDKNATFYPKNELVFIPKKGKLGNQLVLSYKLNIYAFSPLSRALVYVNANTGEIEFTEEIIHEADVTGTAITQYSGSKSIETDSYSGGYRLRESGRGSGIETYNLQGSAVYASAIDFTDGDNTWNNTTTTLDQYATDAHWGAEMVYDYFKDTHNRNSIDGLGFKLLSYVHHPVGANAFWDGTRMTYGDGVSTQPVLSKPLTTIDIVGHEITHGLVQKTANLIYSYESGALNESFADIFGATIDFRSRPLLGNWFMGEECSNSGTNYIGNMEDPKDRNHPDTYLGTNWYIGTADNGGVHTNSGVQNFWYYLLTEGGSGTNDLGNTYSVPGIGMSKSEKITFRNLTVYLSVNSQYSDARTYAIQSAKDLFGDCSIEVYATTEAWYAVGVGAQYPNTFAITRTGKWCDNNIVLTDNVNLTGARQWYRNGVLLTGETGISLNISSGGFGAGNYTLKNLNGTICKFAYYTITAPIPLTPNFVYSSSCAEHIIAFTDMSLGNNIVKYFWNFGNGKTDTLQNPTHKFNSNGTYSVSLTVTDNENCSFTITKNVTISKPIPLLLNSCACLPASYVPNHSFEDRTCCPNAVAQMTCAQNWIQASAATSDYFNTCGTFSTRPGVGVPSTPLPHGIGYVGFWSAHSSTMGTPYKEYVGACLTNTLEAGRTYVMEFYLTHGLGNTNLDVALFGSSSCADIPFGGLGYNNCPTAFTGSNFIVLQSQNTVLTSINWSLVTLTFTPTQNINSIVLGPSCATATLTSGVTGNYYYMDDLKLTTDVKVKVQHEGHLCRDDLVISAVPLRAGGHYVWFKDGVEILGEEDSVLNVSQKYYGKGKYSVMYVLRDECVIDSTFHDSIPPVADFNIQDICFKEITNITDLSTIPKGNIISWEWEIGDEKETVQNPSLVINKTGIIPVKLTVKSDSGCINEITKNLEIFTLPDLDFTFTQKEGTVFDTKTCFTNYSSNSISYLWDFDFKSKTSILEQPGCILFPNTVGGIYNVCIDGVTDNGCKKTFCKDVKIIDDNSVYVPNTFTPNGNGLNEVFRPVFLSPTYIVSYEFNIFTRWGELIFSTNDPTGFWDGKFKGELSKTGTYTWNLKFKDKDGRAKFKIGYVTLLR